MNKKTAIRQLALLRKYGKSMRLAAEQWKAPWQTLIATILSARTRDEKTIPVAKNLFQKYNTINKLANANISGIETIIRPINFYKTKARSVSNCSKKIVKEYNSQIPKDFEKLINLPGVGRKTANVFLSEYGGNNIAVDTHVHYISNYLGWSKNKNPHKVEEALKNLFPKTYWSRVNPTLVRFGKTYTSRKEKNKLLSQIKHARAD